MRPREGGRSPFDPLSDARCLWMLRQPWARRIRDGPLTLISLARVSTGSRAWKRETAVIIPSIHQSISRTRRGRTGKERQVDHRHHRHHSSERSGFRVRPGNMSHEPPHATSASIIVARRKSIHPTSGMDLGPSSSFITQARPPRLAAVVVMRTHDEPSQAVHVEGSAIREIHLIAFRRWRGTVFPVRWLVDPPRRGVFHPFVVLDPLRGGGGSRLPALPRQARVFRLPSPLAAVAWTPPPFLRLARDRRRYPRSFFHGLSCHQKGTFNLVIFQPHTSGEQRDSNISRDGSW